jgi:hypothetical protein
VNDCIMNPDSRESNNSSVSSRAVLHVAAHHPA